MLDGLHEIESSVTGFLPAAEPAVADEHPSCAAPRHVFVRLHQAELQPDGRDRELPRGPRGVASDDRAIEERLVGVAVEGRPLVGLDPPDEAVGIEGRSRIQCEYATVFGIQHHCRAAHGVGEDVMDPLHQIEVEIQLHVHPGLGRLHDLPERRADDPAQRIHL